MSALEIRYRRLSLLKPREKNPRTHSKKQIRQLARSIKEFGFLVPVLVDANGQIIAGHGRCEAAKLNGMSEVPTLEVDHLTPAQVRAYVIADNQLATKAGWDRELLALELNELSVELDCDLTVMGFETSEVDLLIAELGGDSSDPVDEMDEPNQSMPAITRTGDLWKIGHHRVLCGDATENAAYERLLGETRAQMVFSDVPYNVPIDGNVCGLGRVRHREFAMASGEMSQAEFTTFLRTACEHMASFSADGAIHAICMDWRHSRELLAAGDGIYSELKNICVWVKTNGGMGSFYRSQHEFVFIYKCGSGAHINNIELGKHGRNRTNVWEYPGINTFGNNREANLLMHPTVKPVRLVADAILDCSNRGGIILDPFAGSGTTLIAAEMTGRCGYGIEIDPRYVDTILRRFRDRMGIEPINTGMGETLSALEYRVRSEEGASDAAA